MFKFEAYVTAFIAAQAEKRNEDKDKDVLDKDVRTAKSLQGTEEIGRLTDPWWHTSLNFDKKLKQHQ